MLTPLKDLASDLINGLTYNHRQFTPCAQEYQKLARAKSVPSQFRARHVTHVRSQGRGTNRSFMLPWTRFCTGADVPLMPPSR